MQEKDFPFINLRLKSVLFLSIPPVENRGHAIEEFLNFFLFIDFNYTSLTDMRIFI